MQTLEGVKNLRKNMIKKYGSEEAWKQVMAERGRIGGTKSGTGGFYYAKLHKSPDDPSHPKASGIKGGHLSKRGKAKKAVTA